jgi:hypothetical protein
MTDDYTRALSELQGAASEVASCYIAGRRTDEALAQYEQVMRRARKVRDEMGRRHATLADAIVRATETIDACSDG